MSNIPVKIGIDTKNATASELKCELQKQYKILDKQKASSGNEGQIYIIQEKILNCLESIDSLGHILM